MHVLPLTIFALLENISSFDEMHIYLVNFLDIIVKKLVVLLTETPPLVDQCSMAKMSHNYFVGNRNNTW